MTLDYHTKRCEICGSANLLDTFEGLECQQCGRLNVIRGYVDIKISRKTLMAILDAFDYYNGLFVMGSEWKDKMNEFIDLCSKIDAHDDWKPIAPDDKVY